MLPLGIFMVHPRSALVFRSRNRLVEDPNALKESGEAFGILWQIQSQNPWTIDADVCNFHRIVIDIDKTVEAEIEFPCEISNIVRFVVPVDTPACEVCRLQEHVVAAFQNLEYILLIVLAAKTQEHSSLRLRDHEFLQPPEWVCHFDAMETVFSADTLPEGIVTIEDDHLKGTPIYARECSEQASTHGGVALRGIRNMARQVCLLVVPLRDRIVQRESVGGDDRDVFNL